MGASGSGKSSVVLAGLVPQLQEKGNWLFTHFRPGTEPFLALAQALVPLYQPNLDATEQISQQRKLAEYFQDGSVLLQDIFARIERNYPNRQVLLIADQFEELYTLCPNETIRRQFLDLLLDSFGANPQQLRFLPTLVTTMRADFLGKALAYRPFADILRNSDIKLGAMNQEELSQVITKPAATVGVSFESGLAERILTDVENEPGNLALLEFALTELWRERIGDKLTHQAYEKIGLVKGALAKYAEEQYQQLSKAEQKQAQQIFVQLVSLGEENNDTRRRVERNQLGKANWQLVTRKRGLADSRLVVTSLAESKERETLEIVHEALIGNWQRLRQWIDTSREQLKQQHRLEDEAKQWQDSGYKIDYLLSKKRLKEAKEFQQEQKERYPLSELAHSFIKKR
ncbi:WD-40 repeat-containing protein (fragment) [Hyella patelloides LEGE 07179]|uniref:WD-40 repeat-containing protein n=1 Tax=Hyella patelloides LEGE 07179 TaxID=945734 RepID=A0A563VUV2_9CYAN